MIFCQQNRINNLFFYNEEGLIDNLKTITDNLKKYNRESDIYFI